MIMAQVWSIQVSSVEKPVAMVAEPNSLWAELEFASVVPE
jgi:hypothetical protein